MSQFRDGVITGSASAISLNLGFVPDYFQLWDYTLLKSGTVTGIGYAEWFGKISASPSALITTYTTGAGVVSYITTNGFSAISQGGDWLNTQYVVNNITNASPGVVTVATIVPTNTLTLVNGMTVTMSGINGMTGINGQRFIISNLTLVSEGPTYTFTLYDLFGNPFSTVGLGTMTTSPNAMINEISYPPTAPVLNPVNGQVITPGQPAGNQYDQGYYGISIGTGVYNSSSDTQLYFQAWSSTPTGW